jgi:hypothetical protein
MLHHFTILSLEAVFDGGTASTGTDTSGLGASAGNTFGLNRTKSIGSTVNAASALVAMARPINRPRKCTPLNAINNNMKNLGATIAVFKKIETPRSRNACIAATAFPPEAMNIVIRIVYTHVDRDGAGGHHFHIQRDAGNAYQPEIEE